MTVVDKAGVLPQLIGRHVEVITFGSIYCLIVIGLGPSVAVMQNLKGIKVGRVFPL